MTRSLIALLATLVALTIGPSVRAGAIVGATEFTQIANMIQLLLSYVEQAQQTVTQINQYQAMLRNLQQMTPSSLLNQQAQLLWQDQNMTRTFGNLRQLVVNGQTLSYSLSNLDGNFRKANPGYKNYGNGFSYSQAYANWSDTTLGAVKNAIALTSAHADNFATEDGMMRELQNKSQTASGQLESLQSGQQISMAMVGQMQKLRQLQMAQMDAQNAFMAGQQNQADAGDAALRQFLTPDTKRVRTLAEIKAQTK